MYANMGEHVPAESQVAIITGATVYLNLRRGRAVIDNSDRVALAYGSRTASTNEAIELRSVVDA